MGENYLHYLGHYPMNRHSLMKVKYSYGYVAAAITARGYYYKNTSLHKW